MNLKTLFKISYGLYIVSSRSGERFNGQIANTVFQVTSEPPRIAVCINKENLTYEFIQQGKVLTISILSESTPMQFIGLFGFKSGRHIDKFKDTKYKLGNTGAPIVLEHATGYIECKVINSLDAGTHVMFVCEIVDAEILSNEKPMTYAYYHEVIKGKAPKTAPTYMKEVK